MQNENDTDNEKTHAQSIASDIFNMIQGARGQGLDMSEGFQNEPLSTRKFALRYLFYGKRHLSTMPGAPAALKKRLRVSNVLAAVLVGGRMVGVHLLCALDKPFAAVETEAEVLAGIDAKALDAYAAQVRSLLTEDFNQAVQDAEPSSPSTN